MYKCPYYFLNQKSKNMTLGFQISFLEVKIFFNYYFYLIILLNEAKTHWNNIGTCVQQT